jgi:hypothetical protein
VEVSLGLTLGLSRTTIVGALCELLKLARWRLSCRTASCSVDEKCTSKSTSCRDRKKGRERERGRQIRHWETPPRVFGEPVAARTLIR